jgi:hypothetical protein
MGYTMFFVDGQVLLCVEGGDLDETMRLGIRKGMMYRLLGKPIGGSKGVLE